MKWIIQKYEKNRRENPTTRNTNTGKPHHQRKRVVD